MRIYVGTYGAITISKEDGDNLAEVLKAVDHFRAESRQPERALKKPQRVKRESMVGSLDSHSRPGGALNGTLSLNTLHYQTWAWMVDHDVPSGLHVQALTRGLRCSSHAVAKRMKVLIGLGYVERIGKGRYRAIDGKAGGTIKEKFDALIAAEVVTP